MNVQLPPERDLPAHVLREIEAELVAAVSGDAVRRRRWLVPVAAAAAVLVMLGVVVGVLRGGDEDRVRPAAPPSSGTSRVGDLPTGRVASIVPECAKAYGNSAPGPIDPADAKLYALHGTASKGLALIYTDEAFVFCIIGQEGMAYHPGGGSIPALNWIAAPYQLDWWTQDGTRRADGEWYRLMVGGRVAPNVASVMIKVDDAVITLPLQNRTFVFQFDYPAPLREFELYAYDKTRNRLPDPSSARCLTTPDGEQIGNAPRAGETCAPAVAWP